MTLLDRFPELGAAAEKDGYSLSCDDGDLILIGQDTGNEFVCSQIGDWVVVKALWVSRADVAHCRNKPALFESLLSLQSRLIGCRFGLYEQRELVLLTDLYAGEASSELILRAAGQMQAIIDALHDDIARLLIGGPPLSESRIDEIFGFITCH